MLTYLALVDDRAGVTWALLLQLISPPANVNIYLLVDFWVSMVPAQSTSVNPLTSSGS